ncbi:hypothetical protein [Chromatium okenii]|uniref:hypothetical protein n=1 Tax=Chromatium okenii TaxID=61644 RepID=UPI00308446E0
MMTSKTPELSIKRRLINCLAQLSAADRDALLAFAEFLVQRRTIEAPPMVSPDAPVPLPRPTQETVIGAIKRLSQTYPMLDRTALLNETSTLMSAHVIQGRTAESVIDALETLFAQQYQTYCARYTEATDH